MFCFISTNFRARPKIFQSEADKMEFIEFLTVLSNVTYENYDKLPLNRTFDIPPQQYLDLLWNLSYTFNPEINSGTATKLFLQDTITELGICYAINSKMSVYNSYR